MHKKRIFYGWQILLATSFAASLVVSSVAGRVGFGWLGQLSMGLAYLGCYSDSLRTLGSGSQAPEGSAAISFSSDSLIGWLTLLIFDSLCEWRVEIV